MKARWLQDPQDHDFPAAIDYLSLLMPLATATALVEALQAAPTTTAKAKDILRASRLPLLGIDDPHIKSDLDKIKDKVELSPVLLVRGNLTADVALTIADGYHRVCASYQLEPNTVVPCRIIDPL